MNTDNTHANLSASADKHTDTATGAAHASADGQVIDYEKLLSPSPLEFILLILEIFAQFIWRVARFSPTTHLCNMLGHGFNPEGSRLPERELKQDRPAIPETHDIEIKAGGFPVGYGKNGLEYSEPVTKAQATAERKVQDQVELTEAEWDVMKNYNPPLLNVALACKIKAHWLAGRSDKESAILADCSLSYAKHYRLAFERAARRN